MARRTSIPYKDIALRVVGPREEYLAARIQRLDMPVDFPSTDVEELGNSNKVGTVRDIPEVTATFQAMDVSVKLFAALTGTDASSYPGAGVSIDELGEVDLIGVIKDATVADFIKSVHCRKCQVTDFTFTYSVDAEATEEYTVSGSKKTWFKYDVFTDTFDDTEAAASPVTLSHTPLELKSGDYCLSVILDGEYLTEVAAGPSAGEYSVSGTSLSFADTVDTMLVVVYHIQQAGNNWVGVSDDAIPPAIYGKDIPVTISANSIPRLQSITVRGTFPNTVVKEMGTANVVGTTVQVPEVTGDITVLDTDTDLVALFTTGEMEPSGVEEFRSCEFTVSGLNLKIELEDPEEDLCGDTGGTVLKTVYIPNVSITSEGHTSNVGENVTQTFGFKGDTGELTVYSGSM